MLAHRSIGVILLLLLTKVLELPGQNVAALVSAKPEEVAWPEVQEGPTGGAVSHST